MPRKAIVNTLFVLAAVGTGLALSARPWQVYREQQALTEQRAKAMRDAERRHADDLREAARLESPAGREELARNKGWHKPGEVPLPGSAP